MPSRSRKRASSIQRRRRTTSSRIMAMCAAGPPKPTTPSLRKTAATSRRAPLVDGDEGAVATGRQLSQDRDGRRATRERPHEDARQRLRLPAGGGHHHGMVAQPRYELGVGSAIEGGG